MLKKEVAESKEPEQIPISSSKLRSPKKDSENLRDNKKNSFRTTPYIKDILNIELEEGGRNKGLVDNKEESKVTPHNRSIERKEEYKEVPSFISDSYL